MQFEETETYKEIDANFVAIKNSLDDNADAHEILNNTIVAIKGNIDEIVNHISTLPTPDKILYKPAGADYMNIKDNFDYIYKRLNRLEETVFGDNK
ncbi:hypothetical protein Syn7803C97_72 [Synechococcus phage S-MbCM6]|jgi:hypothetical protein|uniref:Uncharacterized protein n=3 Tax=Namakavirus smbcm6 TaxID=2734120 RepID=H8ZMH9_9CAUD|nr:hypothetical protein [Synechococcus phage ACG-2014c]AHB80708.1 hypothetical protein S-MbCM25_073 [Synechococcus phage S-MbCM25]AFD02690.1 hypothetical protein [Synechococcus phage ACG-2014c]AIX14467.1 hypothetical protein Syn7803C43_72 [Synechococcus phage ACG-2014c]AIX22625.1 hypothetical protein Syn7803C97_72 [Synechococcus phage ACG-2014c]AIX22840.1 hypothetical protein Syn7803C98_72 [Synechococcus phage ACG-2014c]